MCSYGAPCLQYAWRCSLRYGGKNLPAVISEEVLQSYGNVMEMLWKRYGDLIVPFASTHLQVLRTHISFYKKLTVAVRTPRVSFL